MMFLTTAQHIFFCSVIALWIGGIICLIKPSVVEPLLHKEVCEKKLRRLREFVKNNRIKDVRCHKQFKGEEVALYTIEIDEEAKYSFTDSTKWGEKKWKEGKEFLEEHLAKIIPVENKNLKEDCFCNTNPCQEEF